VRIWEHKRYLARPALAAGDGPLGLYRKWTRQFYSAEAGAGWPPHLRNGEGATDGQARCGTGLGVSKALPRELGPTATMSC
jgi:hypothetical protein